MESLAEPSKPITILSILPLIVALMIKGGAMYRPSFADPLKQSRVQVALLSLLATKVGYETLGVILNLYTIDDGSIKAIRLDHSPDHKPDFKYFRLIRELNEMCAKVLEVKPLKMASLKLRTMFSASHEVPNSAQHCDCGCYQPVEIVALSYRQIPGSSFALIGRNAMNMKFQSGTRDNVTVGVNRLIDCSYECRKEKKYDVRFSLAYSRAAAPSEVEFTQPIAATVNIIKKKETTCRGSTNLNIRPCTMNAKEFDAYYT